MLTHVRIVVALGIGLVVLAGIAAGCAMWADCRSGRTDGRGFENRASKPLRLLANAGLLLLAWAPMVIIFFMLPNALRTQPEHPCANFKGQAAVQMTAAGQPGTGDPCATRSTGSSPDAR